MLSRKLLITLLALLIVCSTVMAAEEKDPGLVLNLSAEKEVSVKDKDGTTSIEWQETSCINPGDVLRYTIAYKNEDDAEAREAVIVDPVPEGTAYIVDSAEGNETEITFSLDGKTFGVPQLLTYTDTQADGTETKRVAAPDMYTHIKWKLSKPVPKGESGNISFMVKVK